MDGGLDRAFDSQTLRHRAIRSFRPVDSSPGRGWWRSLAVGLVAVTLLVGSLAPGAGAVSYTIETNLGSGRLSEVIRSREEGLTVGFDVPLESQEIVAALSFAPGTEFRLTSEASQIPAWRDPSQPGSSLLRGEAWVGLPSWPLAVGALHQSISWQWAMDGAGEQIPISAAGWGLGLEGRLALTPHLVVGAGLRATPWASWTDEEAQAADPHRLFFLGYDLDARYFLSSSVALRAGFRWDTLRNAAYGGISTRDISRSRLFTGVALGF